MSIGLLVTRAVYGPGAITADVADAREEARAARLREARARDRERQDAVNAQTLALIKVRIHA